MAEQFELFSDVLVRGSKLRTSTIGGGLREENPHHTTDNAKHYDSWTGRGCC